MRAQPPPRPLRWNLAETNPGLRDQLLCRCGAAKAGHDHHTIDCWVTTLHEPHAMGTSGGDVFYPDSPGDAAYFARWHDAWPINPDAWPWEPMDTAMCPCVRAVEAGAEVWECPPFEDCPADQAGRTVRASKATPAVAL